MYIDIAVFNDLSAHLRGFHAALALFYQLSNWFFIVINLFAATCGPRWLYTLFSTVDDAVQP